MKNYPRAALVKIRHTVFALHSHNTYCPRSFGEEVFGKAEKRAPPRRDHRPAGIDAEKERMPVRLGSAMPAHSFRMGAKHYELSHMVVWERQD